MASEADLSPPVETERTGDNEAKRSSAGTAGPEAATAVPPYEVGKGTGKEPAGASPGARPPWFPAKVVSIPVPVVATTPNEGTSYGGLGAFLLYDKKDQAYGLVAPQANYNANFGYTGTLYGAFYPSPERQWEVTLSKSTIINQDFDARFRDKTLLDKKLELTGYAGDFTDGSARFFGFQSESKRRNQTNYADTEKGLNFSVGYDVAAHFQVSIGDKLRDVSIDKGAIKGLPSIGSRFTEEEVPGINGYTVHTQRVAFIYNSTDSRIIPTSGLYGKALLEVSTDLLGSSDSYQHYEAEMKGYFPLADAKYISVVRFAYSQTLGNNVPFLERSILGGENTLRGYGRDRFIDDSYLLANLEERVHICRWNIFDVDTDIELAPFLDAGAVAHDLTDIRRKNFKYNPGIGFRGLVRPNIVGRVDMGVGSEGIAVFAGLGYPF